MDEVTSIYDPNKKIYRISCPNSNHIYREISKIIGRNRAGALMSDLHFSYFKISKFALLELSWVLEELNKSLNDTNDFLRESIEALLRWIASDTWLIGNKTSSNKMFFSPFNKIKMLFTSPYDTNYFIIFTDNDSLSDFWLSSFNKHSIKKKTYYMYTSDSRNAYNNERIIIINNRNIHSFIKSNLAKKIVKNNPNIVIDNFLEYNHLTSKTTHLLKKFITKVNTRNLIITVRDTFDKTQSNTILLFYFIDETLLSAMSFFYRFYKKWNNSINQKLINERIKKI